MRSAASLLVALGLVGCALAPAVPPPEPPWRDAAFGAPGERIAAEDVFALSEPMHRYLRDEILPRARGRGRQLALTDALLKHQRPLRLEYDATTTRNAAQAFEARAGNCLSLVVMVASFAKALGLQVEYHSALLEEHWSRQGDLLLRSGHLNVTIGPRAVDARDGGDPRSVTIDFLPPEQARHLRARVVDERTVVAMFMANRAAEALVRDRLDDAYAWARAAIRHQPAFLGAHNTLGVVYLRRGDARAAEAVLRGVLAREPAHTRALANLALALSADGRDAEAAEVRRTLARLEPQPPFHFLSLGMAAMERQDYAVARDWFARELARDPELPEVHHALAMAHFRLGDEERARTHLARAVALSATGRERDRYASKLAWLRGQRHE